MTQTLTQPRTLSTGKLVAIIGTLAVAAFVMILNETVLTVALPSLMADFSISSLTAGWFTTGFLLTMAICIPLTGYLMQRFSTKMLFLVAIVLFGSARSSRRSRRTSRRCSSPASCRRSAPR
ncbi:MFS transporter [Gulosibacter sediminis]|uniref:MFS transporter n=1 Tax=Gulosibacter sediminis TaxID=1729695 RepID=UPI001867C804|nr:MFS transporter [Gulosibacter sediminis]